jgi:hypothetical protein
MTKTIRTLALSSLLIFAISSATTVMAASMRPTSVNSENSASSHEDWKGDPDSSEVHLGVLSGIGILDEQIGFVLRGTASKKIVHHGFVSDLNDSVSLETEMGPLFVSGSSAFVYSLHLRWDFQKDANWTIYALGGVGGAITSAALLSRFTLLPRFGVGAFYHVNELFMIRGEISHDMIGAGVTFPFWL